MGTQDVTNYQLVEEPMPPAPPSGAEGLIQEAFKNRPEMASYRLLEQSDEKFAAAEHDLKRPTVTVGAVGGALPYIDPGNANPKIPTGYEAVGLNLQIPIFNGHLFSARERAADYRLQAAQQRTRDLAGRIARDVRASFERSNTAFQAIAATDQLMQQANLALELAQGRYNLGLSSIVELSQAQLSQTQAQVENLDSKFEYQEAYQALQYTLGLLR
jgi:outer membrane protein